MTVLELIPPIDVWFTAAVINAAGWGLAVSLAWRDRRRSH